MGTLPDVCFVSDDKNMEMIEFKKALEQAVGLFIANEEEFGDNSVVEIDPEFLHVSLRPEVIDEERYDYYSVMDFLEMSREEPGKWEIAPDAMEEVVKEYLKE